MAVAGVVNWISTFIIAISFESVQSALGTYTFIVFCGLLFLSTVFTYFFVPETKNKTFEEIAHQFSPGGNVEVEEEIIDDNEVFQPSFSASSPMSTAAARIDGPMSVEVDNHKGRHSSCTDETVADSSDSGIELKSVKTIETS
jgi:hypothetical protein